MLLGMFAAGFNSEPVQIVLVAIAVVVMAWVFSKDD